MGTTQLCAVVCKIITTLRPVTPECVGTNGSVIDDTGVSTLKQAYSV